MTVLLKAKEVTKTYENAKRPSLNKISFSVENGEFISIMGASGSGKTTLLNVLSTIDTPTGGEIQINGTELKSLSPTAAADFRKNNLGFIFQEYFLLDSLTIRENISVPLALLKVPPAKIEKNVRDFAKRFGIASQLDKYPCELSGGQRQRFSVAHALLKKPDCLLLDEATAAMDIGGKAGVWASIRKVMAGKTVVYVAHDAQTIRNADYLIVLRDGRVQSAGERDEVLASDPFCREMMEKGEEER